MTEKVLEGENIFRDGAGRYFYNYGHRDDSDIGKEYIERIKKLFLIIRNYFGEHYSFFDREMSYEDYYYFIDSMHKDEGGEIENPVVTYFSETLFKAHALLFGPIHPGFSSLRLIDLMRESLNYIKYVVVSLIDKEPEDLTQLNFLKNMSDDSSFVQAYIFTLNHDRFIEKFFNKEKINFNDGFIPHNNTIRIWSPESYNNDLKINLFKLHGSIYWDMYDNNDPYDRKVCINSEQQRDASDPLIIIGSFNKLNEYSRGINFELQFLFWKYLNECDRLIVSGYSFGDQGINSRIINWLYKSKNRKLIIVHKNEKELLKNARGAIWNNWDSWKFNDAVRVIPKWIEETNWEEIKRYLL